MPEDMRGRSGGELANQAAPSNSNRRIISERSVDRERQAQGTRGGRAGVE
jgi:hypothetical protein